MAGSPRNAALLARVAYWHPHMRVERRGVLWIVKSREEWMAESGLSLDQYKRALKALKARGLVETRQGLWGRPQRNVTHLRLTATGQKALSEWGGIAPLTVARKRTTQSGAESHHSPNYPASDTALDTQRGAERPAPEETDMGKTAAEVLAAHQAKQEARCTPEAVEAAVEACSKQADLLPLWRAAWGVAYPERSIPPWGREEKNLAGVIIQRLGGYDTGPRMFADAVLHWPDYTKSVDCISAPDRPLLAFMAKHVADLTDWWVARASAGEDAAQLQGEEMIR